MFSRGGRGFWADRRRKGSHRELGMATGTLWNLVNRGGVSALVVLGGKVSWVH